MSTTDFMVKLHDAACMVVDATEEWLEKNQPQGQTTSWTWNPEKVHWTEKEGPKGVFQLAEDINNPDFKAMLKDLQEHKEHLFREGMFYWMMNNGAAVGRKKKQAYK
ncbi:hypothetical protein MUP77_26010 [Candidatus Bathyarchaeota archaeon]|nr:hypothetical protein [Candidatus Bathyarchaeota archaeon]